VSPALIPAADPGLILGDEVEVHAKGMIEALRCRELLGHEDHPELVLDRQEISCLFLAEPQPLQCMRLSDKHLNEQMQPATLVGLSRRRGLIEACRPLEPYANIMLRLSPAKGDDEVVELYAKVIRPDSESENRYLVHFTSIPPEARARLRQLLIMVNSDYDFNEF
jgi:adenylate cyclase